MEGITDRVLRLIEASGQNRRAFAQDIGLDDSKLSKSLNGARRFSSLDLARIADKCGVTVDWLVTGEEPALAVAARTISGEARTAIAAAKRYSTMREDLAVFGWEQPWRPLGVEIPGDTYTEQGKALAVAALARVAEGGLSLTDAGLPTLVEKAFGVDVVVVALDEGFDGLAASSDEAKLIVLGTSQIPARQRFTLAHELGHLLVGDDQGVHLDKDVYDRAQAKDPSEMRANSFASAFLMPEDILRSAVRTTGLTEDVFAALSCDLQVSPSALAIRLQQLRLIDAGTCDRFKKITAAKAAALAARNEEFARGVVDASAARPPGLLVRDSYMAYESGATTLRPYANLLGVDVDELRRALEAEEGIPGAL
jgi:Zn-dependent peptidase ImmA (M78 family)/transcriptional regulator with XRE-family HTH domain